MVLETDMLTEARPDAEPERESLAAPTRLPAAEPGLMTATVYSGGRRVRDIRVEEAHEWAAKPGHMVWIGLHEPSYELLSRIQAQFGLHDLAIEDAGNIGEIDQMICPDEFGAGRGHVIGVDVVELPVDAQAKARSNRSELLPPE